MSNASTLIAPESSTRDLASIHRIVAGLLAGLILVMAAIAGNSIFGTWDIALHGYLGNAFFALALANAGLAVARKRGVVVAALIVVAAFAQTGLGYVGRENLDAAAWHIPNGVLLMGLTTYQFAGLRSARR